MKIAKLLMALLVVLGLTGPAKAETPSAVVKEFYAQLEDTMKQGTALGFEGRFKKLEPAVKMAFNLPLMTRLAVGLSWNKIPAEEQQKLTVAFSDFSAANYAKNFSKFDGEVFEVLGEKPTKTGDVIVETTLTPKGSKAVILNYLVRPDEKGVPRIVDVFLDASISELATRRSEFSAIIKRDGAPALIATLQEKIKKMGSP